LSQLQPDGSQIIIATNRTTTGPRLLPQRGAAAHRPNVSITSPTGRAREGGSIRSRSALTLSYIRTSNALLLLARVLVLPFITSSLFPRIPTARSPPRPPDVATLCGEVTASISAYGAAQEHRALSRQRDSSGQTSQTRRTLSVRLHAHMFSCVMECRSGCYCIRFHPPQACTVNAHLDPAHLRTRRRRIRSYLQQLLRQRNQVPWLRHAGRVDFTVHTHPIPTKA
jgi:hypothetical protein